jgi:hypothetical protein
MSYLKDLQDHYKAVRERMQANALPVMKALPKPIPALQERAKPSEPPKAGLALKDADGVLVTEALRQSNPDWIGGNHSQAIKIAKEMANAPKLPPLPGLVLNEMGAIRWVRVLRAVAEHHEIDPSEILSTCRKRHINRARFEVFYRLRMDLNFSYTKIAQLMKRDHTSVLHGVLRMKQMILDGLVETDEYDRSSSAHLPAGGDTRTLDLAAV